MPRALVPSAADRNGSTEGDIARNHTLTIEVALAPQQAEAAVHQAFLAVGLLDVAGGGGAMHGKFAAGMSSWGEKVQATIGFGPNGSLVTLYSESLLLTQPFDMGKNRKNLERIVEVLRTLAPVV